MEIKLVVNECSMIKRKDSTGKMVKTEVYKLENGKYHAVSYYPNQEDEESMGVGKSDHDREAAIKRSREHLKKMADSLGPSGNN
jgi:hypothetical protein